jgi:hypothetical protein
MHLTTPPPKPHTLPCQWKRLLNAWSRLHPWQRKVLLARAWLSLIPRLHPPVAFSLRASLIAFAMLFVVPPHPMSMVIAACGGLSLSLLIHVSKGWLHEEPAFQTRQLLEDR